MLDLDDDLDSYSNWQIIKAALNLTQEVNYRAINLLSALNKTECRTAQEAVILIKIECALNEDLKQAILNELKS